MIWATLDNHDETRTLKQHCFSPKNIVAEWSEEYEGNISLCGLIQVGDDDRVYRIEEIKEENYDPETACKTCSDIFYRHIEELK